MKLTKIIATIGPQSRDEATVSGMVASGMNVVRMNFSHGSYDFHLETIETVRRVSRKMDVPIGILMDLQGPKLRTGGLKKETVTLNRGDLIELTTEDIVGDWKRISIDYDRLPRETKKGERILLDDGSIELRVEELLAHGVMCRIMNGGTIRSHRGVNFPESRISVSAITDKDREDLSFGIAHGVDFVALSFVRGARDIVQLRALMKKGGRELPVVAKIEKPEAVENIDEIILKYYQTKDLSRIRDRNLFIPYSL
jgi:pyruvate kinase